MGTVCKGTDKNVVACLNLEFLNYFVQIIETYAVKQIMFFQTSRTKILAWPKCANLPPPLALCMELKKGGTA